MLKINKDLLKEIQKDEAREILIRARKRIAKRSHWTQEHFVATSRWGAKSYCAMGAILEDGIQEPDFGRFPLQGPARTAVERLTKAAGLKDDSIMAWNDHPARTHKEVLEAFDKAISYDY